MQIKLFNININSINYDIALKKIEEFIKNKDKKIIFTPNVHHLVLLNKDKQFQKIYKSADLILPDGMPLIWASKLLKIPIKERIAGSDIFISLCKLASKKKYKLFFLGGNPGVAQKAKKVLEKKYPGINITGVYSPPFGFEKNKKENIKIINMIKKAKPDILFVGLGAPKQEFWIYNHYKKLNVPVSMGIGISFDFIAGTIKRAPKWMQKSGLEWFWRILMEPERLWKRYLYDGIIFFWLVLKEIFRNKNERSSNRNNI